jgi:hypothetical protein
MRIRARAWITWLGSIAGFFALAVHNWTRVTDFYEAPQSFWRFLLVLASLFTDATPIGLAILAFTVGCFAAATSELWWPWLHRVIGAVAPATSATLPAPSQSKPATAALASENAYLSLEARYGLLPVIRPPSGRFWVLSPVARRLSIGLHEDFGTPGAEKSWPRAWGDHKPMGYEFTITNHGSEPVFGLQIPTAYRFLEAVIDGKTMRSGEVIKAMTEPLYIEKVSPGEANAFVFYADNYSGEHVHVSFGTEATAKVGPSSQRVSVPLQHEYRYGHFLTPFEDVIASREKKRVSES